MVLINSVLNSITIFFLSFMTMPVEVWKQIVRLQRCFLWGGSKGGNKISWASWSNICKPKREGALGVRDIRLVNLALFGKWRWRILAEGDGLWRSILSAICNDVL